MIHGILEDYQPWQIALGFFSLLFVIYVIRSFLYNRANPFLHPKNIKPDYTPPKDICQQNFDIDNIPEDLDGIVIGSGISGLSTAALFARQGKRILVLEQHDIAGGCCHTFEDHGYEFDTGIHYIGGMGRDGFSKRLADAVTGGKLEWEEMTPAYDICILGMEQDAKRIEFKRGKDEWLNALIEKFPEEKEAIEKYLDLCKAVANVGFTVWMDKMFKNLYPVVDALGLGGLMKAQMKRGMKISAEAEQMKEKTVTEVVNGLTENQDLRMALMYLAGDYGMSPSTAPFFLHAAVQRHYLWGAFYPVGGPQRIPELIIQEIEKAGGKVFVKAPVEKIIVEQGEAVGVTMANGAKIFAPMIISAAGAINTFQKLLPEKAFQLSGAHKHFSKVESGPGHFYVFVALKGSTEELNIPMSNYWIYPDSDIETKYKDFLENPGNDFPGMFFSFPSAKDPEYAERCPNKSVAVLLSEIPYEWFEEYKDQPMNHRDSGYKNLKEQFANRLLDKLWEMFPHLEEHYDFKIVATPLSNAHYLNSPKGESYGLNHTVARMLDTDLLKPETPIKNLWLTGQDITSAGFLSALIAGYMTASCIMQRNLLTDLMSEKKNPIPIISSKKKDE